MSGMITKDVDKLDKFDLIDMVNAIEDHSFLLRLAMTHLDNGACCTQDKGKELNQGLILIGLYLDHIQEIIHKGVY